VSPRPRSLRKVYARAKALRPWSPSPSPSRTGSLRCRIRRCRRSRLRCAHRASLG